MPNAGFKIVNESGNPVMWDKDGLKTRFIVKADIEKFDDAEWTVSGFASVEEVDKQGDLILLEAFEKAWQRNLDDGETVPLMLAHTSAKVGTITNAEFLKNTSPRKFWIQGKLKKNSKLAGEAYKALKDGRLKAFSIGGLALSQVRYCETSGQCFNKIDDIELYEVSLVDKPANEKSLVMQIKAAFPRLRKLDYERTSAGLRILNKPFAGYEDFDACVSANSEKEDPEAYCATIMREVEGKGEWDCEGLEGEAKATCEQSKKPKDEEASCKSISCKELTKMEKNEEEKLKTELEAKVRAELEAKAKAEADAKAKAEAEATAKKAEADEKAKLQARIQALEDELKSRKLEQEKSAPANEQPDRKGVSPAAVSQNTGAPKSLLDIAREYNEQKKPITLGLFPK